MVKTYGNKKPHSARRIFFLLFFLLISFLYGEQREKTLAQAMKKKSNPFGSRLVSGKDEQGRNVTYIMGSRRQRLQEEKR